ncbi:MAG: sulfotransferase family 2 domain-containing protein [Alphaproteobacteria bacterium]|nr:sulfotransferase family 2 domain-containing protein [Alphaproteobacteria bacterium]MBV9693256.1 sulfotransferase family 2 domain-containing protein [Alphaproteobacteria bacterium]
MAAFFLNETLKPRLRDPDALIVHPHAQRTGGNTLRRLVLAALFGPDKVYSRQFRDKPTVWKEATDATVDGARAFSDHFDFRPNKVTRPLLPVAVLRHPLYRAVSLYHFVRRKQTHKDHELAMAHDLETFYIRASERNPRYYINLQCRRVCNAEDARVALETIATEYFALGFTEELDAFAAALGAMFGRPELRVEPAPRDAERYDSLITPSLRARVLADNAQDLLLYETMRAGPPYSLPIQTAAAEARSLLHRARRWAATALGR